MPNLDLKINGDCISAVKALSNTEKAVGSLQRSAGSGVGVAVSVSGARAAAKDLGGVAAAMNSTTAAAAGLRSGGAIASGLGAGATAARGLTTSLGGTSRALTEARSGVGALTSAGGAATRTVGGLGSAVAGMTSRIGDLGRTAGRIGPVPLPGGGAASIAGATRAVNAHRVALAAQQLQMARGLPVLAMANAGTSALAGNTTAASTAATRLAGAGSTVAPVGAMGAIRGAASNARADYAAAAARVRGESGLPPVVPPPPRPGGGGGGDGDAERRGAAAGKAGAEIGKGIGSMLMAGLAVGIAADATITKYGVDAVNQTIAATPILAKASADAMEEFGKGIGDAAVSVAQDAVPAFDRLATSQRALGQITGQIGMEHMGTWVEGQAQTADATTRALGRMNPAFDASIKAATNLGTAMINGISNPQVVNGVRSLSQTLAKPEIAKGIADITTGATASGLVFAKVAADISGTASKLINGIAGSDNVTDMSGALFGGATAAALGFSRGGIKGGIGAGILGGSAVLGSQHLMATGQDDLVTPSLINMGLGSLIGARFGGMPGMVAGGLAGQYGTQALGSIPGVGGKMATGAMTGAMGGATIGMLGGPVGAAAGATVGGLAGATYGDYKPGQGPADDIIKAIGLGSILEDSTGAAPGPVQPAQHAGKPVESLVERKQSTQARVNAERQERGQRPAYNREPTEPGPAPSAVKSAAAPPQPTPPLQPAPPPPPAPVVSTPVAPAAYNTAAATQQLSQGAQQATQSVQQLGQAMPQVAQQAQAMPVSVGVSAKTTASLQSAAVRNMDTAAGSIGQSASQIGSSIPANIGTGIAKATPKVCDPAADMGNSMVNCTARALQSASPSKKFIALGESTGDGAKIGVANSASGAVGAVGDMVGGMLGQVGALGSGVEAASDGAVPIAEAGGLMVGYAWARSVATGVDSVIKSADFVQASMPTINSALAKTTLGQMGLLGLAGSGASISKSAGGGFVSMGSPAPIVNATVQVSVDGIPLQVIAQRVVDTSLNQLVDSIGRQRG